MIRTVSCSFLKKDLPGLDEPPFPGLLGKQIFEHVSQEAWAIWMLEQTKFINEQRLKLHLASDRAQLKERMISFLELPPLKQA